MPRGSPGVPRARRPVEERFWAWVERRGPDECWPWLGALRKGYGSFKLGIGQLEAEVRKDVYAHRVAFRLTYGRWPDPQALHGCDNPVCCNADNPLHVHEGTPLGNMQEKMFRGRGVNLGGELAPLAVLSNEQARQIRERRREPQRLLAVEFGVSQTTISRVVRGLRYHLGTEEVMPP